MTNINIIQNNIPYFTRDLGVGSNVFVEAVQREFGVTFEEAENMLSGASGIDDANDSGRSSRTRPPTSRWASSVRSRS